MTGFHGQKFDFTGEDGEWYCLLSDSPGIHINMRVTSPVQGLPEITYITGLSIMTADAEGDEHSIVITVKVKKRSLGVPRLELLLCASVFKSRSSFDDPSSSRVHCSTDHPCFLGMMQPHEKHLKRSISACRRGEPGVADS